jgi:WD40 repeat protein
MEPPNPLILKMEFDPLQHLLLLLTSDGQVYLTRRKLVLNEYESSESPYKIQGVKVHTSDGSKSTFASNIALNTKFFLIAISTKGDQVIIYSYSKSASQPQQLFSITIGGLVTSLAWSNDGECLAVGSSTKGVSLFDICGNLTLNTAQINYILS